MKHSLMTGACVALSALAAGCASTASRDALQVQNTTVLQRGVGATQDDAAGAATPAWLDTYRTADNAGALDSIQKRLDALGAHKDNYFGYKAQCWLDAARDERSRGDHWGFVEEALREASRLASGLETGGGLDASNPELRTSAVLLPDVWKQILTAKSSPTFPECQQAQRLTACAEVEMIHAGHFAWTRNFTASGQRVDKVTKDLPQIDAALASCTPPPEAQSAPPAAKITLQGDATFEFDRADLGGLLPEGKTKLDRVIGDVKRAGDVTAIRVDGYTDRLGNAARNRRLSAMRAETVKRYLAAGGIGVPISAQGLASANPLVQCDERNRQALIRCLAPNRRVELGFTRGNATPEKPVTSATPVERVEPPR
ncbi:OmpA/MotB family outer membrane protein [Paraburkholderia piptadeniae]|uniref:OmpA/MotB family outer membrane protein n=1 Tax=Paraburkholderia piptadeniae TaxID=1701573 RepID=A0A1N7S7B2_9BURK|nr:OmpA family protein [Paraburkholderia piptadeniae]SIT43222.1 OmpA/MotB family outer membrane protein [Paraburkholderia piptadeniae]